MPRPATPKLPVSQTLISEVLQRVSNAKTKGEKVNILREYDSEALRKVLLCNFARSIRFVFPAGKTPYTPQERPKGIGHSYLFREHRLLDKFIKKLVKGVVYYGCSKGTRPAIQQLKKENLWIQLLESLHEDEAFLLDLLKDKSITDRYKITRQNVIEAFPQLRLQDEQEPRVKPQPAPTPQPEAKTEEETEPKKPAAKPRRRRTTTKKTTAKKTTTTAAKD